MTLTIAVHARLAACTHMSVAMANACARSHARRVPSAHRAAVNARAIQTPRLRQLGVQLFPERMPSELSRERVDC